MSETQFMRRVPLFLVALLPLLLAGCSDNLPLAAMESDGTTALILPSCATKSVVGVRVFDETTLKVMWEVEAPQPGTTTRAFFIGESVPGFDVVVPLTDELTPGTMYEAMIIFGGGPGDTAGVRFNTDDLEFGSLWFDGHRGTREEFESSAQDTALCGATVSLKSIFWTKFGLGCLIFVVCLVAFVLWGRRSRFVVFGLRRRLRPGWYHRRWDGMDTVRWWDGNKWTGHVARRGPN